jgi:hypothetical protein
VFVIVQSADGDLVVNQYETNGTRLVNPTAALPVGALATIPLKPNQWITTVGNIEATPAVIPW